MMNCVECGKLINDTDKTCPNCGVDCTSVAQETQLPPEYTETKAANTANRNEIVLLAQRAMNGDDSVWGEIYEKTQRYVYFIALKTLRSEQAATMLSRLADAIGKPLPQQTSTFNDNGSIASWAFDAVGQMQVTGIMGGVGDNTFSPQGPCTREQSIMTIWRLFEIVK